jgi:hypothetical protein
MEKRIGGEVDSLGIRVLNRVLGKDCGKAT